MAIAKRKEHGAESWVLLLGLVRAFDRVPSAQGVAVGYHEEIWISAQVHENIDQVTYRAQGELQYAWCRERSIFHHMGSSRVICLGLIYLIFILLQ